MSLESRPRHVKSWCFDCFCSSVLCFVLELKTKKKKIISC
uniref:Uncharacterized protein n=1 Tax=Rhizophora mucronata TaxID=61149 RepID=A0A2P2R1R0_RHIMU